MLDTCSYQRFVSACFDYWRQMHENGIVLYSKSQKLFRVPNNCCPRAGTRHTHYTGNCQFEDSRPWWMLGAQWEDLQSGEAQEAMPYNEQNEYTVAHLHWKCVNCSGNTVQKDKRQIAEKLHLF